ncbi:MAG: molybdopterin-dependent oxidoreductase [Paracoccaceae bacterium]
MHHVLDLARPLPQARYAVFYSLADGADGGRYYDVHELTNMRHDLTLLAYEMNGAPLSILHGAPLRLRCENVLGYKMIKWIAAIESVESFAELGAGQGRARAGAGELPRSAARSRRPRLAGFDVVGQVER